VIYMLNADITGDETVAHLVRAGLVTSLTCQMFRDFDDHIMDLIPKLAPGDVVIIDSISSLANQTRGDHKLGTDVLESVWDRSEIFFRDKYGQLGYEAAQQQIMRRVRNIVAVGKNMTDQGAEPCRLYITAHQRDQIDPLTGIKGAFGPDLNTQFFNTLYATASDMFRLDVALEDITDPDTGAVKVAADTRMLYLKRSAEQICKNRCAPDVARRLPAGFKDPTLPKLWRVLGRTAPCLVIYSPGGVGKTTLVCSEAQALYDAAKTAEATETKVPA